MNNSRDIDDIVKHFHSLMQPKESIKKTAGDLETPEPAVGLNPEEFLLQEEKNGDLTSQQLDGAIDSLDEKLNSCPCESCGCNAKECRCENKDDSEGFDNQIMTDEASYLIDAEAVQVMHGLGKIAADLNKKGKSFAADVVEATAFSIRNDLIKEAGEKLYAVNSLNKIASRLERKNSEDFSIDLIKASINRLVSTR